MNRGALGALHNSGALLDRSLESRPCRKLPIARALVDRGLLAAEEAP